jgi:hypothetical protein
MTLSDRAQQGLDSLYFFLSKEGYWGLDLEEQPHREMISYIEHAEKEDSTPNCMLIVPRGTYKSSIAVGAMVWKQFRQIHLFDNPYHSIMFASETLSLGRRALNVIEGQLSAGGYEGRIAEDFGDLWVKGNRNQRGSRLSFVRDGGDGINLRPRIEAGERAEIPQPSFWITSEKRPNTGWHCHEAYYDDLMGEQSVRTVDQREKKITFFRLMWPLLDPVDLAGRPARTTINGTRWHDDDVPGFVLRMIEDKARENSDYKSRWLILQHGAHIDVGATDGPLYFPSKQTEAFLREQEDLLGPYLFSCNYLNDPVGVRGMITDDEQIRFLPRAKFPQNLRDVRCTVDPNQHRKGMEAGCWAAGLVVGFDRYANLYVLDGFGSREWGPVEFISELFEFDKLYPTIPFLIEDEHMAYLDHSLKLEQGTRGHRLHIRWIPTTRNEAKADRWKSLIPRFKHGQIFFAEEIDPALKREIKSELVRGTASRYTDFLDALAIAQNTARVRVDAMKSEEQAVEQNAAKVLTFSYFLSPEDAARLEEARLHEERMNNA